MTHSTDVLEDADGYTYYKKVHGPLEANQIQKWINFGVVWTTLMAGVVFKLADFSNLYISILSIAAFLTVMPDVKIKSWDFVILWTMSAALGMLTLTGFKEGNGSLFIIMPLVLSSPYFNKNKRAIKYQSRSSNAG